MIDNAAPQYITRRDGATIAYHVSPGKGPGVVFMAGYKSDMMGGKALHIEQHCRTQGRAFLRFDYFGHGQSSGDFEDGTIGRWAEDAVAVLDELTEGPQVLIGSSMGGWIMLLCALARPDRAAGLLGIAAAPDFTEDLMDADQRRDIIDKGVVYVASDYGPEPTPYTRALLEDGRENLVLRTTMAFDGPVRLIHGMNDNDVPWQTSLRIAQMLRTNDVETIFVKGGDHRLSEDADLDRLTRTLDELCASVENRP